jgi:hypothetical protein
MGDRREGLNGGVAVGEQFVLRNDQALDEFREVHGFLISAGFSAHNSRIFISVRFRQ